MSRSRVDSLVADAPDPLDHERRFGRAPAERRRAHVEQDRPIGGQPDLPAERLAIARRRAVEPLVEALGAGHHDPLGGHAVQIDGLLLLRVVPHEHAIGHLANQRLAGQMIPAPDAERRRNAERTRGAQIVDLRRPERDERRHEHDVGPLLLDERADGLDPPASLARATASTASTDAASIARSGRPHPPSATNSTRRALARPLAQHRRVVEQRVLVAEVLEAEAQATGRPTTSRRRRDPAPRSRVMVGILGDEPSTSGRPSSVSRSTAR